MRVITALKIIVKVILITAAAIMVFSLSLLVPVEAATNDDLAFDFIGSEENQTVKRCYEFGEIDNYTYNQTKYWPVDKAYSCKSAQLIAKQAQSKINVDSCYKHKIYTKKMTVKVKSNKGLAKYNAIVFYSLGDFCQQVYDELYPREYEANEMIRGIVK